MKRLLDYLDSLIINQDYQSLALVLLCTIMIVAVFYALAVGIAKLTDHQLSKNDTFTKRWYLLRSHSYKCFLKLQYRRPLHSQGLHRTSYVQPSTEWLLSTDRGFISQARYDDNHSTITRKPINNTYDSFILHNRLYIWLYINKSINISLHIVVWNEESRLQSTKKNNKYEENSIHTYWDSSRVNSNLLLPIHLFSAVKLIMFKN